MLKSKKGEVAVETEAMLRVNEDYLCLNMKSVRTGTLIIIIITASHESLVLIHCIASQQHV